MLFHISTVVLNPPWTTTFEANTPWKWKKRVCAFRLFFFWVHSHFGAVGFFFLFLSGFDLHFSHYFIMKLSGFWVFFFVLQTTLLLHFFPSYINASSSSGNLEVNVFLTHFSILYLLIALTSILLHLCKCFLVCCISILITVLVFFSFCPILDFLCFFGFLC